jgi:glycerophosphoryl diester phosphodiesterase
VVASSIRPGRTLRLSHRGDWRHATENTLAAFQAALAVPGCDGLEFDVQAARGGVADVLAAIPRRAFLDVELKGDPGRGAFEALVGGRGPGLERAVVSSFEPGTLRRIAGLAPTWPLWLNTHDVSPATIAAALELGCRGISVEWHGLDAAAIARTKAAGLDVVAWTVRRRPTYRRLERLGLAAICVEAAALDG